MRADAVDAVISHTDQTTVFMDHSQSERLSQEQRSQSYCDGGIPLSQ